MKTNNREMQFDFSNRLFWFLATAVGWSLSLTIGLALGEVLGRYANVAFYAALVPVGAFLRDIFAGFCVGIATGIFQWPVIMRTGFSIGNWPLKSAILITFGFVVARILGAPVVNDVSGFLLSVGFSLPPRWFPVSVGSADYTLGGPIAGALVGVTVSLLHPNFLPAKVKSWVKWLIVSSLPSIVAFTIGSIPSLLGADLIVIAVTTAIAYAIVDTLLIGKKFDQLDIRMV